MGSPVPIDDLPEELKPKGKFAPASDVPEPIVGRPDVIGPTPATGEMRAAPGPIETGIEETARTGAFIAGETAGGLAGTEGGPLGMAAGAAAGAGTAGTMADAVIAYAHHMIHGTPIDLSKKRLAEDWMLNAATSLGGAAVGKVAQGAIPAEKEAVTGATERLATTQRGFSENVTEQGQKTMESLAKEQKSQLGEVSPQGQIEAVQQITGRTPATAAKAALPELGTVAEGAAIGPSAETLAKQGGMRGTYFSVKNRIGDAYGGQYEKLLGKHMDNKVNDLSPINDVLDKWEGQFTQEGRAPTAPIRKLIEESRDIAPRSFLDIGASRVAGPLSADAKAALQRVPTKDFSSTVSKVLALRRAAQKMMVSSTDDRSSQIAEEIADSANKALATTGGLPKDVQAQLSSLNAQYADYKRMFPHSDIRAMATAQTPIEGAERVFGNPTLADRVISNANPEEKKVLQDTFGDWAQTNPDKLLAKNDADALLKSRVYGKLFPGSPLADPKALTYIGATMQNIEQAPKMAQAFQQSMQQAQQQAIADGAVGVRDAGLKAAKELGGPAGTKLERQIRSAKTPQEASQVAFQYFTGTTPDKFIQQIAQSQKLWEPSVARSIARPPGDNKAQYWIQRLMENPKAWPLLAGYGAFNYLGHGSVGFMGAIGAAGTVPVMRRVVANAFVQGLEKPEMARALLTGSRAARLGIMHPLAMTLFKAMSDDVGSRLAQHATGITMEPQPEEESGEKATP